MSDLSGFYVGQRVRALKTLGDAPCGDSPGGVYAGPGEILIVRKIGLPTYTFPIAVSHADITDSSFGVATDEIKPVEDSDTAITNKEGENA